jgi:hypothetical protein
MACVVFGIFQFVEYWKSVRKRWVDTRVNTICTSGLWTKTLLKLKWFITVFMFLELFHEFSHNFGFICVRVRIVILKISFCMFLHWNNFGVEGSPIKNLQFSIYSQKRFKMQTFSSQHRKQHISELWSFRSSGDSYFHIKNIKMAHWICYHSSVPFLKYIFVIWDLGLRFG